jgi:hypothetical protein
VVAVDEAVEVPDAVCDEVSVLLSVILPVEDAELLTDVDTEVDNDVVADVIMLVLPVEDADVVTVEVSVEDGEVYSQRGRSPSARISMALFSRETAGSHRSLFVKRMYPPKAHSTFACSEPNPISVISTFSESFTEPQALRDVVLNTVPPPVLEQLTVETEEPVLHLSNK